MRLGEYINNCTQLTKAGKQLKKDINDEEQRLLDEMRYWGGSTIKNFSVQRHQPNETGFKPTYYDERKEDES